MQTYNNVLHVYGLHWTKETALPLGGALEGGAGALRRCDLYLQHSVALEQARDTCVCVPVCVKHVWRTSGGLVVHTGLRCISGTYRGDYFSGM